MPIPKPTPANLSGGGNSTVRLRGIARTAPLLLAIGAFDVVFGTAWHEIVGHGGTAVALGNHITYLEVLGFQLHPDLHWVGMTGAFGRCHHEGDTSPAADEFISLAGSLSTWIVSVSGASLLYLRRWRGWMKVLIIALSVWWVDLLLNTLPSFGLRQYIPWLTEYSEPYEAAVELGVPAALFQSLVLVTCVVLATAVTRRVGAPWSWPESNRRVSPE